MLGLSFLITGKLQLSKIGHFLFFDIYMKLISLHAYTILPNRQELVAH